MRRYGMVERGQRLNKFAQTIASRWLPATYVTRPHQIPVVVDAPFALPIPLEALPGQNAEGWMGSAVTDQSQILQQDGYQDPQWNYSYDHLQHDQRPDLYWGQRQALQQDERQRQPVNQQKDQYRYQQQAPQREQEWRQHQDQQDSDFLDQQQEEQQDQLGDEHQDQQVYQPLGQQQVQFQDQLLNLQQEEGQGAPQEWPQEQQDQPGDQQQGNQSQEEVQVQSQDQPVNLQQYERQDALQEWQQGERQNQQQGEQGNQPQDQRQVLVQDQQQEERRDQSGDQRQDQQEYQSSDQQPVQSQDQSQELQEEERQDIPQQWQQEERRDQSGDQREDQPEYQPLDQRQVQSQELQEEERQDIPQQWQREERRDQPGDQRKDQPGNQPLDQRQVQAQELQEEERQDVSQQWQREERRDQSGDQREDQPEYQLLDQRQVQSQELQEEERQDASQEWQREERQDQSGDKREDPPGYQPLDQRQVQSQELQEEERQDIPQEWQRGERQDQSGDKREDPPGYQPLDQRQVQSQELQEEERQDIPQQWPEEERRDQFGDKREDQPEYQHISAKIKAQGTGDLGTGDRSEDDKVNPSSSLRSGNAAEQSESRGVDEGLDPLPNGGQPYPPLQSPVFMGNQPLDQRQVQSQEWQPEEGQDASKEEQRDQSGDKREDQPEYQPLDQRQDQSQELREEERQDVSQEWPREEWRDQSGDQGQDQPGNQPQGQRLELQQAEQQGIQWDEQQSIHMGKRQDQLQDQLQEQQQGERLEPQQHQPGEQDERLELQRDEHLVRHQDDPEELQQDQGQEFQQDQKQTQWQDQQQDKGQNLPPTRARPPRMRIEEWVGPSSAPVSKASQPERRPAESEPNEQSKQESAPESASDVQSGFDSEFEELPVHSRELTASATAEGNAGSASTVQSDARSSSPLQSVVNVPDTVQPYAIPSGSVPDDANSSGVRDNSVSVERRAAEAPGTPHQPDQEARLVAQNDTRIATARTHDILRAQPQPTPLSLRARHFLQPLVGIDLTDVRVHRGIVAEQLTTAYRADAINVGNEVAIASGYADDAPETLGLLAHEFTHLARRSDPRFVPPVVRPSGLSSTTTSLSPLMPRKDVSTFGSSEGTSPTSTQRRVAAPEPSQSRGVDDRAGAVGMGLAPVRAPIASSPDWVDPNPPSRSPVPTGYPAQEGEEGLALQVESRVAQMAQVQVEQVAPFNTANTNTGEHLQPQGIPETAPMVSPQFGSWGGLPAPWEPMPDWLDSSPSTDLSGGMPEAQGTEAVGTGLAPVRVPTGLQTETVGTGLAPVRAPTGLGVGPVPTGGPGDVGVQRAGEERSLGGDGGLSMASGESPVVNAPEPDLDVLAQQVHAILKKRLAAEQRRSHR